MKTLLFTFVFMFINITCFSQKETLINDSLIKINKDSSIVILSEKQEWSNVKELITSGISCNTIYKENTPLIWASYYGDLVMVKYLLSKGADPNLGDTKTPLSVSDKNNFYSEKTNYHPEVVKLLAQNALSKSSLIKGVKKTLLVKPTIEEIRNSVKTVMRKDFGDAGVGIEFVKILIEDPVKQKIRVYGNAATWTHGMVYNLGYLDYFVLTRKPDGKWEAEMVKRPDDWYKTTK
jgi:hypothetical protein